MKKLAEMRFLLSKNKQARRAVALVCLVLVMLSGLFASVKILDEKERVSAHPTNTIKLDEGGANEFEVPVDDNSVFEQALTSQAPKFNNYMQNDDIVAILEKKIVDGTGALVDDGGNSVSVGIISIERTTNGNYAVLYGFSGNSRGGLIRLAVFNKEGNLLAEDLVGRVTDIDLRINTGFYNISNNKFLVGTHNGTFYRYEISGETDTTAIINRVSLAVPNNPNTNLKANLHQKVNTFSTYSDNSMIVGRINTTRPIYEGVVRHRIPFASVNVSGWGGAGFSGSSSYLFSVENLLHTDPEIDLPNSGAEVTTSPSNTFYNSDGKLYGTFYNSYYDGTTMTSKSSFQIFDTNEDVVDSLTGENLKRRKFSYVTNRTMLILEEICTNDYVYFLVLNPTDTELVQVDLNAYTSRTIKTFPRQTRIKLINNNDGTISYFGSTTSLTDAFYSDYYSNNLTGSNFFVSGLMKNLSDTNPLDTISVRALETNGYVYPTKVIDSGDNQLFMGGSTTDKDKFIDNLSLYSSETVPPTFSEEPSSSMAFIGVLEINDDYSPAINVEGNIDVDISKTSVDSPSATGYLNWNTLDRLLITGEEDGLVSDSKAVKVYDQVDSNDTSLGATAQDREQALQMKINRNPLNNNAAIEWLALGFDKTKAGAQLVTYFVSDSQGQTSVTSRWVNKKTDQTIEEDEYCLDAQNFHIPLTGVDTAIPDDATFKELAKTMAWNKTSSDIDEDGTDSSKLSSKVTIDATQLQALRDATEAKPYPVDVVYNAKSGVSITNRVWVFVTEENTVPNSEVTPNPITPADTNGVVIYANDYTLPYRMRNTHTNLEAVTSADVKVYDYFDSTHETDAELPTLADATKNANEITVDLPTIQNSLEPETVRPSVSYTWQGATDANHTNGTAGQTFVDVELTGNALLHIRQVVLDGSNEIVVPTVGYFEVRNLLFDQDDPMNPPILDPDYLATFTGKSGSDISNNEFTSVVVPTSHIPNLADQLQITVVVPEFYQYLGYWCTTEEADPGGAFHLTNTDYIDLPLDIFKGEVNDVGEYWITMFIKPNVDDNDNIKTPQPYSWDYKKNDLGKIKTITP